jgi:hypothetical protein
VSRGLEGIDTTGIHRFRVSGEQEEAKARDARTVARHATGLIEENLDSLGANRLPNPLPLRRVVTEILEAGPHGEGLWEEPDGGSAYAAHTVRTCKLALLLGQALGLSEGALQDLGVAVMFHDVGYAAREGAEAGKSGEPGASGYAPPFERHPSAGAGLILRQRGFHEAKIRRLLTTLDHHRRYDDPRGKPSLFGRITAIVEDFDTLIRAGGGALPPDKALARIAGGAGTIYDPALTQLFINALGRFPPGTPLRLRNGCQVRVVAPARGPETFERPLVRVERLADGTTPAQPMLLDLSKPKPGT